MLMNIKERGFTVGDLLIVVLVILSTIFIVKFINNDNKNTFYLNYSDAINEKEV